MGLAGVCGDWCGMRIDVEAILRAKKGRRHQRAMLLVHSALVRGISSLMPVVIYPSATIDIFLPITLHCVLHVIAKQSLKFGSNSGCFRPI